MNPLEKHVKKIARVLHDRQLLRLYKIPNDMKIAGDQLIYGEQQPCDFFGFTAAGRAILLECKMTSRPSLALQKPGLRPHQLRALLEAHRAEALGLVAWMFHAEIAVIDIAQVIAYSEGRKSVPWSAIPKLYKKPIRSDPIRFFEPFVRGPRALS